MKKALVVSQYFWPEDFRINDFCEILKEQGYQITVLTGYPNYPDGKIKDGYNPFFFLLEERNGLSIIRVPTYPRRSGRAVHLILNYLCFLFFSLLTVPFLTFKKYSFVFALGTSPIFQATAGVLVGQLQRTPVYVWVMDLWPESLRATGVIKNEEVLSFIRFFVHLLYRGTDKILCISHGFIDHLKKTGIQVEKLVYFPNWAEESYSEITKPENPVAWPSGTVITYAGNIGQAQDIESLIKAMSYLKDIPDLHLAIFGDGREVERLKVLISENALTNVHYYGRKPQSEMPYYFSKSQALVVTLRSDDLFSLTVPGRVHSALASGKPILGCIDGETMRVIQEANCGFCAPAGNPQEFAESIREFYKMSDIAKVEMGQKSLRFFQAHYSRFKVFNRFQGVL